MSVTGPGRVGQNGVRSLAVAATLLVSGCAAAPVTHTPTPHPTVAPTPTLAPPTPVPVPQGPFTVVVTNSARTGTTYDVLIMDVDGQVVARTTALLPHIKANQTVDLPLVSASSANVYYLNGDTDIYSLSTSGNAALVKSIPAGATGELTFAVSPDATRIAVAVLNEQSDPSKDTSHGYIEDLADTGHHLDVFNNVGPAALRYPIAWHGTAVIDELPVASCGYCMSGVSSYHVVDSVTGNRTAVICESAATTPGQSSFDYYSVDGMAVSAGTACEENQRNDVANTETDTIELVDWSGKEHDFLVKSGPEYQATLPVSNCFAAPDGTRMACLASSNTTLDLLDADGSLHPLGRRYAVLGWIDAAHMLVDIDSSNLGVVDVDTQAVTNVPLGGADKVLMATPLPGGL